MSNKIEKTYLYQINVTRDCNLRCTHCYIHSDVKNSSKQMQDEQIMFIAESIVEHMKKINYSNAEIHIIGGEPTMLGLAFFQKNIPKVRQLLKDNNITYKLLLVSNLLHDDILEIAKLFENVATSYEVETRFVSNKGTYKPKLEDKWLKNLHMLQANGLNVGITGTITQHMIKFGARNLLDYFYSNNIKQIHLGFFIPEGDGLDNINTMLPEFHETSAFLIECAEWYLERRYSDPDLYVNPFESMLSSLYNDEPLDDIVCPIIPGSIDINWDGNAVTCIEEGGSKNPTWAGNVFKDGIYKVTQSEIFMKRVLEANKPQKICQTCDEYKSCKSGCGVLFKYFDPLLDQDCPGFKRFIKYIRGKIAEDITPKYSKYLGKSC